SLQRAIGVRTRDARGVRDRVPGGGSQPEQGAVRLRLRGGEAEGREIDRSWHLSSSISYYVVPLLDYLDGKPEQPGDQSQPEGGVGLALRRALAGALEREVMRREEARRLGHGAQALGAPDAAIVALREEARQHAVRARDLPHQPEPREQLEPVEGEGDVADVALRIGPQWVAQQLEDRLQGLASGENEERPARRGHREIVAQPLDEPRPLALHGGKEREHFDGEDGRRMG